MPLSSDSASFNFPYASLATPLACPIGASLFQYSTLSRLSQQIDSDTDTCNFYLLLK